MHVAVGAVDDVEVHHLAHPLVVQRAVAVGQHVARGGHRRVLDIQVAGEVLRIAVQVPHLQKHQREGLHRLAPHEHGHVLPVAVEVL